jgi:hypothetical protein
MMNIISVIYPPSSVRVDDTIRKIGTKLGLSIGLYTGINAYSVVPCDYDWADASEEDRQNLIRLLNIIDNTCEPHAVVFQPDFWEGDCREESVKLSELEIPQAGDFTRYTIVDDIGTDGVNREEQVDF